MTLDWPTPTGPVAQWIRHRPTEPGIAGSSPAGVIFMHVGWQSGSFYLLPVGCKSHICRCAGLASSGRSEVKTWLAEEGAEK